MHDDKIKVLFLYTVNPGVAYYRMVCFAQKMGELGLAHCRLFPDFDTSRDFSPDWERKLNENIHELEEQIKWADVVVCQYVDSPEGLSFVEAVRDLRPCFMEIDDYLAQVPYQFPVYDGNKPGDSQHFWSTRQMVESTGVITTTQYLADSFKKYNQNVKIIPNCMDFDMWDKLEEHKNGKTRLGWIGGATHGSDLKLIQNVLYQTLDIYPDIEAYIVSCPLPDWPKRDRLTLLNKWAPIDKYPEHLKSLSFDIGLCPLRDNTFNRGKSNLRYLEYSACKIPTVASRVEPFLMEYRGRVAWDDESWFENMSELIENKDLREEEGFEAYYEVKKKFNLNNVAKQYAEYLREHC